MNHLSASSGSGHQAEPSARPRLALDGAWDFRMEGAGEWRTAKVPAPWQALFSDLRHASGTAVYRRRFTVPPEWAGRSVLLCFGAVSHLAEARLDGRFVGSHEGGYLPFEFELGAGPEGEHELEVRVTLPSGEADLYPEAPFAEVPHGKQSWYGPIGGIWQSVYLEARAPQHVRGARIFPDLRTGDVRVRATLAGAPAGTLKATVTGPDGSAAAQAAAVLDGQGEAELALRVERPAAWSPDAPNLYRLDLQLEAEEGRDAWSDSFGFRTIEARDGRILLNGEPVYLRGALDQDYYPDTIATPPSLEFLEDQLRKAKRLGLNCLRIHIKVPDPRYYEVADRLGMLVWTELPNFAHFTPEAGARAAETLEGMLRRDGNHPSIIAWTLINEDWGTELPEDPDHRRWLLDTFRWMKERDPSRLVVDNSPCIPNFHMRSDLDDYHYYRCLPERRAEWDALTREFAERAAWSYSPFGDAERSSKEPLVVSEFGVWGLPHPDKLLDAEGSEPWWMETGQSWGDGTAYPHGLKERFAVLRFDRTFGSFDRFVEATQWHQFRNLKYEIESLRGHSAISGYVITEFTDVHWEANGLLDMRRNPRAFCERFPEINGDVVILPEVGRWAFWCGETAEVALSLASGGRRLDAGCRLEWFLEGHAARGEVEVGAQPPMSVVLAAALRISVPELEAPAQQRVSFVLRDAGGAELARNSLEWSAFPPLHADAALAVWSPHAEFRERFAALGFRAAAGADEAAVVVVRSIDAADAEAIRNGARYLLLAGDDPDQKFIRRDEPPAQPPFLQDHADPVPEGGSPNRVPLKAPGTGVSDTDRRFPTVGVQERNGTMWRGDWITSFNWLRRSGAFAAMPGGPILDLAFERVVPHHVLTGFRPWEYDARVHAGVFVGWAHKPAALIAEKPFGRGKLVMTTFRLAEDAPGFDPVASYLAAGLLQTALARV